MWNLIQTRLELSDHHRAYIITGYSVKCEQFKRDVVMMSTGPSLLSDVLWLQLYAFIFAHA
jgi:hypothetical protein